jgi:hypothetical protein
VEGGSGTAAERNREGKGTGGRRPQTSRSKTRFGRGNQEWQDRHSLPHDHRAQRPHDLGNAPALPLATPNCPQDYQPVIAPLCRGRGPDPRALTTAAGACAGRPVRSQRPGPPAGSGNPRAARLARVPARLRRVPAGQAGRNLSCQRFTAFIERSSKLMCHPHDFALTPLTEHSERT